MKLATLKSWLRPILITPLSDKQYAWLLFVRKNKKLPNLRQPQTFNEKILWLKLNYYDTSFQKFVDKLQVREYVPQIVPNIHLIPLLGVYQTPDEIPFDHLPQQFVLKTNHGSAWNIPCEDKSRLDIDFTKRKLATWLNMDYYNIGRERFYKGIKPRILCEEYLRDQDNNPAYDYKFFCFHGEPQFVQVDYDRFTHHTRSIYDLAWNKLPCCIEFPNTNTSKKPPCFDEMVHFARQLSQPFPFVRVDFYQLGHQVFFGELTFVPKNCCSPFYPKKWDKYFGDHLHLEKMFN